MSQRVLHGLAAAGGVALTDREREVARMLARNRTNQEIASELFIAEATVKSHINSILSKLQVSDRTQAVTLALKRGLVTM